MGDWLTRSGLDVRFYRLAVFMSLLVWPWIIVTTFGVGLLAWKLVFLCQAVALPFAVFGWAAGFRAGRALGLGPRGAAMLAGWSGLVLAEIGMSLVLAPWFGSVPHEMGLWALPALVVLVTVGVLWFYRSGTWQRYGPYAKGAAL